MREVTTRAAVRAPEPRPHAQTRRARARRPGRRTTGDPDGGAPRARAAPARGHRAADWPPQRHPAAPLGPEAWPRARDRARGVRGGVQRTSAQRGRRGHWILRRTTRCGQPPLGRLRRRGGARAVHPATAREDHPAAGQPLSRPRATHALPLSAAAAPRSAAPPTPRVSVCAADVQGMRLRLAVPLSPPQSARSSPAPARREERRRRRRKWRRHRRHGHRLDSRCRLRTAAPAHFIPWPAAAAGARLAEPFEDAWPAARDSRTRVVFLATDVELVVQGLRQSGELGGVTARPARAPPPVTSGKIPAGTAAQWSAAGWARRAGGAEGAIGFDAGAAPTAAAKLYGMGADGRGAKRTDVSACPDTSGSLPCRGEAQPSHAESDPMVAASCTVGSPSRSRIRRKNVCIRAFASRSCRRSAATSARAFSTADCATTLAAASAAAASALAWSSCASTPRSASAAASASASISAAASRAISASTRTCANCADSATLATSASADDRSVPALEAAAATRASAKLRAISRSRAALVANSASSAASFPRCSSLLSTLAFAVRRDSIASTTLRRASRRCVST
eukprot:scaffold16733_cov112-Isochrysis_galbana.AAC.4